MAISSSQQRRLSCHNSLFHIHEKHRDDFYMSIFFSSICIFKQKTKNQEKTGGVDKMEGGGGIVLTSLT